MDGNVLLALGLTLFAGLATGVGSLIAFLHQEQIQNFYHSHWAFQQGS